MKKDSRAAVKLAESIINDSSRDYLICLSSDGDWEYSSSNRTWALGAARRVVSMLEEMERIDIRKTES